MGREGREGGSKKRNGRGRRPRGWMFGAAPHMAVRGTGRPLGAGQSVDWFLDRRPEDKGRKVDWLCVEPATRPGSMTG